MKKIKCYFYIEEKFNAKTINLLNSFVLKMGRALSCSTFLRYEALWISKRTR